MTDNEIIKALECCMKTEFISDCAKCEMLASDCKDTLIENALDLINRQKAEILELQKRIINWRADMDYRPDEIKSEAIKEFEERLSKEFEICRKEYKNVMNDEGACAIIIAKSVVVRVAKEMTEVETNQRKEDESNG